MVVVSSELTSLCVAHRAAFNTVAESMKSIGFTEKELECVLVILAAILLIGEIVSWQLWE